MAKTISKADFDAQVERIYDLLKQIGILNKKVIIGGKNRSLGRKNFKSRRRSKAGAAPLWTTIAKNNVKKVQRAAESSQCYGR